jgi:hypothetical protein
MKATKVSIISKEVHAKTLYAWLVDNGYDVAMLGDNPTAIPSSTDVLVCRHRSCSHQASHLAQAWTKKTGSPLIMENGLKTISNKILQLEAVHSPSIKEEKEPLRLEGKKLDTLLEKAAGKTMSWLASRLGTRVDLLIPALIEMRRLGEVSAVLGLVPTVNEPEVETPTAPTFADLEEYAAIILDSRMSDPFDVQLAVLRQMAEGSVGDDVLRSVLNGAVAALEEPSEEVSEEVEPSEVEEVVEAPAFEGLRPEESPMAGVYEPLAEADPGWLASGPSNLMEAFEALRQEVVALRSELRELKTPRGSVTLDDLIAAGATISIEPKKD